MVQRVRRSVGSILLAGMLGWLMPMTALASEDVLSQPGAILVFPEAEKPMPDLAQVVTLLRDAGYRPPGSETTILDGRKLLRSEGDGVLWVGDATERACPAGSPVVTPDSLQAALGDAEKALSRLKGDDAARILEVQRRLLPCMTAPLATGLLYRLHYGLGLAAWLKQDTAGAQASFARALAVQPSGEWDNSWPPAAWNLFLKAQSALNKLPQARVSFLPEAGDAMLVDGRDVPLVGLEVAPGEHVIQLKERAGSLRTWVLDVTAGESPAQVWFLLGEQLRDVAALFGQPSSTQRMQLEVVMQQVGKGGAKWALLVNAAPAVPDVLYVDEAKGRQPAPESLQLAGADEGRGIVPGGSARAPVASALRGWRVAVGLDVSQQLSNQRTRLGGLEVGGFRQLVPGVEAHLALGIGLKLANVPAGESPLWQKVHLGARKTWTLDAFGLFVDGGLLVCNCTDQAALGGEVRGGARLNFSRRDSVEFMVGAEYVPMAPLVLGQSVVTYQRAF